MKDVRKIEKDMNSHAENLVNIMNAGGNTGHTKRIKSNLKTVDNQVPILSGTHKDHKKVDNTEDGPDLRPIMGATVGPNVALTNFLAKDIVRRVAEDASEGNDCKSTEELQSHFEEYNKARVENGFANKNIFISSMDIDKWFPSMKTRPMAKEVGQMVIDSNIEFKEVDYDKVSKYLGEHMTIEEILEEELEELLYIDEDKLNRLKKLKEEKTLNTMNALRETDMKELDSATAGTVSDDERENEAHKKCGKHANNQVELEEHDSGNARNKEKGKGENDSGNVTIVSDGKKGNKAHTKTCRNTGKSQRIR